MDKIVMDKNVCDNTLVFGSCHARSCIEVPSLTEEELNGRLSTISFLG